MNHRKSNTTEVIATKAGFRRGHCQTCHPANKQTKPTEDHYQTLKLAPRLNATKSAFIPRRIPVGDSLFFYSVRDDSFLNAGFHADLNHADGKQRCESLLYEAVLVHAPPAETVIQATHSASETSITYINPLGANIAPEWLYPKT